MMATVTVTLSNTGSGLCVSVDPWKITLEQGYDLEWKLVDPQGLSLDELEVNAKDKEPPTFPEKKPSPPKGAIHGPFQIVTPPGRWNRYNIVLQTPEGEVTIDPDYRVEPGRVPLTRPLNPDIP